VGFNFGARLEALAHRCDADCSQPLALAVFASFWFVLELFVVKEQLFAGGEDELTSAVHAV
jgi:hypothetical protein